MWRDRLRHAFVALHDIVGRQLGQLFGSPTGERIGLVSRPVGALHMEVGAQEGGDAFGRLAHLCVGAPLAIVPLIVLARRVERRQRGMDIGLRRRRGFARWPGRQPVEGRAHQSDSAEDVGPDQGAVGGDEGPEIVSDHGGDRAHVERCQQIQGIAHDVEQMEGGEIAVVVRVPTGCAAVTALVRRDHMVAGLGQRGHHLAPAIGQFGKAMQQQQTGPTRRLEAGLQDMHPQPVRGLDEAGPDGRVQGAGLKRGAVVHPRRFGEDRSATAAGSRSRGAVHRGNPRPWCRAP